VVLSQISQNMNCEFVDVSDLESEEHFPDGVHYNEQGHKIVANRLLNKIVYVK